MIIDSYLISVTSSIFSGLLTVLIYSLVKSYRKENKSEINIVKKIIENYLKQPEIYASESKRNISNTKDDDKYLRYLPKIIEEFQYRTRDYTERNEKYLMQFEKILHELNYNFEKRLRSFIDEFQHVLEKQNDLLYYQKSNDNISNKNAIDIQKDLLGKIEKLTRSNVIDFKSYFNDLYEKVELLNLNLKKHAISSSESDSNKYNFSQQTHQIVREISHSLNTPLSHIEVIASSNISMDTSIKLDKQNIQRSFESCLSSIKICKSVIAAYRELTLVAGSSTMWSPNSLKESVISASKIYMSNIKKKIPLKAELPETVEGYSNNFVVSILLPLVENAIESNKNNCPIEIYSKKEKETDNYLINIVNRPNELPLTDEIYKTGYTTKENHDGLGLSLVRNLLSTQRNAKIEHSILDDKIIFTITLPVR
jgi:signal transduction histidine kinase